MADVEAVLQEPYEQRLDLSTYSSVRRQDESLKGGVDKRMIQRVAALQSCTVEFKTGNIMLVKGPEKQATEKFQRLLLAQFDLPVRTKDVILSGVPPNKEFGFIVVAPHMDDSPSQTPIDPHGRFTLSFKIAGGDAGKPKQLPEPDGLPEALMLDAHNRLKDPATFGLSLPKEPMSEMINASDAPRWHARPSTEFTTYYTHLLHRSKPNVVVLPVYTKELVGQLKMSPRTSPTVGGLPYILQQLALDTDIPVKTPRSRVRISLIPSPFTYNVNALRGMPTITMNLLLHPRDRQVSIESVQATLGTRGAHAMLGHLGMDMSMARREYLSLNDPESDPSLQAFVTSIAASYATFSSTDIFVPLNLKLRIPSYTLIPGALRKLPELQELAEAKEDVEIEYFAVSAQHQSDLIFDYEGQELVYRRSKDVETGKVEENVLLQNLSDGRGTEQTPLRASETAERPIDSADQTTTTPLQDFLETSQDVLCRLNAGLGKVRRMDDVLRKTEREARKQEEQQRQEASWDEGEGRFEEKPKSIVDDEGYSSRDRRIKGGVKVVKDPEESISVQ